MAQQPSRKLLLITILSTELNGSPVWGTWLSLLRPSLLTPSPNPRPLPKTFAVQKRRETSWGDSRASYLCILTRWRWRWWLMLALLFVVKYLKGEQCEIVSQLLQDLILNKWCIFYFFTNFFESFPLIFLFSKKRLIYRSPDVKADNPLWLEKRWMGSSLLLSPAWW